jgi:probable RNA-binding protein EIF1AD
MSGSGRKGSYRKGVTDNVLNDTPLPEENELVVRVKAPRGGNVIEIICGDGTEGLAVLPTKFRKLVWIKRGDYVIVAGASADIETAAGATGAIRFRVVHVLYREQIKFIKNAGMWPPSFDAVQLLSEGAAEEPPGEPPGPATDGAALPSPPSTSAKAKMVVAAADAGYLAGLDMPPSEDEEEDGSENEDSDVETDEGLVANPNRRGAPRYAESDESDDEDKDKED